VSFGYVPKFSERASAEFRALDLWLQEVVLDEVDRIVDSLPPPSVSQRLDAGEVVYDAVRTMGGVQHYLFITTELDVGARLMRINRVGHFASP